MGTGLQSTEFGNWVTDVEEDRKHVIGSKVSLIVDDLPLQYLPRMSQKDSLEVLQSPEFLRQLARVRGLVMGDQEVKDILNENKRYESHGYYKENSLLNLRDAVSLIAATIEDGTFRSDKLHLAAINNQLLGFEVVLNMRGLIWELSFVKELQEPLRSLYLAAALWQVRAFYSMNAITAHLFMLGGLISAGFAPIYVPEERMFDYMQAMDILDSTDDATRLVVLLLECAFQNYRENNVY